jgi:hypothetical protein
MIAFLDQRSDLGFVDRPVLLVSIWLNACCLISVREVVLMLLIPLIIWFSFPVWDGWVPIGPLGRQTRATDMPPAPAAFVERSILQIFTVDSRPADLERAGDPAWDGRHPFSGSGVGFGV